MQAMLIIGAFTLGTHNGLASVGYPLLLRRLFGGKHYSQIYSYVNACVTLLGGFTASIVGYAAGLLGTFEATILVLGFGLAIVLVVATFFAMRSVGKIRWDDSPATSSSSHVA